MKLLEKVKTLINKIKGLPKKTKIAAIAILGTVLAGLALGLTLGLTLPIKSVTPEGDAVLLIGEEYESGLVLKVKRRSGKISFFEVKPYMISPFDTSERGTKEVTVTFKDRKIKANIIVVGLEDTVCSVRTGSMKERYEPGEAISQGGILDLSYNDKPFRSFPITDDMISGFDTALSGEYDATVTFRGAISCKYHYVVMKIIDSLRAVGKLYAEMGVPLTKENVMGNGTILVTYKDNTTENVSIYDEFVQIKPEILEERENNYQTDIELTYRGQVFVFSAEAYLKGEQYSIESMELALPKKVYKVGDAPNLEQAVLSVKYRYYSGSVRVAIGEDMVVTPMPFDSPGGSVAFTVVYMDKAATDIVRVVSEEEAELITDITTTWRGSSKGPLVEGEELDLDGATISVEYGYGYRKKTVPLTAEMVSGYDPNTAGAQKLTLTYDGFAVSLSVVVLSSDPEKVTALTGVTGWKNATYKTDTKLIIPEGAKLGLEYGYGAGSGSVPLSDPAVKIEGFSPGVAGTQVLTIKYKDLMMAWTILVADDTISGVTGVYIKEENYSVGEEFDPDRTHVVLEYEGGKRREEKPLSEIVMLGGSYHFGEPQFDPSTPGSYVLYVNFEGFLNWGWQFVLNNEVVLSGLFIDTQAGKTVYSVGEEPDRSGFVLYANYSDGSAKIVPLVGEMIQGFRTTDVGTFYASVTYNGKIGYFTYTVK